VSGRADQVDAPHEFLAPIGEDAIDKDRQDVERVGIVRPVRVKPPSISSKRRP